jgi:hypothetical protein
MSALLTINSNKPATSVSADWAEAWRDAVAAMLERPENFMDFARSVDGKKGRDLTPAERARVSIADYDWEYNGEIGERVHRLHSHVTVKLLVDHPGMLHDELWIGFSRDKIQMFIEGHMLGNRQAINGTGIYVRWDGLRYRYLGIYEDGDAFSTYLEKYGHAPRAVVPASP